MQLPCCDVFLLGADTLYTLVYVSSCVIHLHYSTLPDVTLAYSYHYAGVIQAKLKFVGLKLFCEKDSYIATEDKTWQTAALPSASA